MNIIEYLAKREDITIQVQENGDRTFVSPSRLLDCFVDYSEPIKGSLWDNYHTIQRESYERYDQISLQIHIDDEKLSAFHSKYATYRMRGARVSKEQAFDMIRKTDSFFKPENCYYNYNDSEELQLDRGLFEITELYERLIEKDSGWVYPDGRVGCNGVSSMWTSYERWLCSVCYYVSQFPYVDLIFAISDEECFWENQYQTSYEDQSYQKPDTEEFCKVIQFGIWAHEGRVEVVTKDTAARLLKQYEVQAGYSPELYFRDYYTKQKKHAVTLDYVKQLTLANGYDVDKQFARNNLYSGIVFEWQKQKCDAQGNKFVGQPRHIVDYMTELEGYRYDIDKDGNRIFLLDVNPIDQLYELFRDIKVCAYDRETQAFDGDILFVITAEHYEEYGSIPILSHLAKEEIPYFKEKYPVYRMRGKTITKKRALEIIQQTDSFFQYDLAEYGKRYKSEQGEFGIDKKLADTYEFRESIITENKGWVRPDGRLGYEGIPLKWPELTEWLSTLFFFYRLFPDLEMVFAMTDDNGSWYKSSVKEDEKKILTPLEFCQLITYGFWLHDGIIEIVDHEIAARLYLNYEKENGYDSKLYAVDYMVERDPIMSVEEIYQMLLNRGFDADHILDWMVQENDRMKKYKEEWDAFKKSKKEHSY